MFQQSETCRHRYEEWMGEQNLARWRESDENDIVCRCGVFRCSSQCRTSWRRRTLTVNWNSQHVTDRSVKVAVEGCGSLACVVPLQWQRPGRTRPLQRNSCVRVDKASGRINATRRNQLSDHCLRRHGMDCLSLSFGVSGRGWVLGIESSPPRYGTLYNGITDDRQLVFDVCAHSRELAFGNGGGGWNHDWQTVLPMNLCARASRASLCVLLVDLVNRTVVWQSVASVRVDSENASLTWGLTEADTTVAQATVSNDTQTSVYVHWCIVILIMRFSFVQQVEFSLSIDHTVTFINTSLRNHLECRSSCTLARNEFVELCLSDIRWKKYTVNTRTVEQWSKNVHNPTVDIVVVPEMFVKKLWHKWFVGQQRRMSSREVQTCFVSQRRWEHLTAPWACWFHVIKVVRVRFHDFSEGLSKLESNPRHEQFMSQHTS